MNRRLHLIASSLFLAAASTGVAIPSLRALVGDGPGRGGVAGGAFVALHIAGGMVAVMLLGPLTRRAGELPVRALAVGGLLLSLALDASMAAARGLGALLALRFVEGMAHVAAVMALMVAGATGSAEHRARRMTWLGGLLVLGVGAGIGVGGHLTGGAGRSSLVVAAGLAGLAALVAAAAFSTRGAPTAEPSAPLAPAHAGGDAATSTVAPGLLAMGERFAFGVMTVTLPFGAADAVSVRRAASTLGVFMLTSVVVLPAARRLALRWSVEVLRRRAVTGLALALVVAAVPDVLARPGLALVWAVAGGAAAGGVYAAGLALVARHDDLGARMRAMGLFHSAGSAGHALGSLAAGFALSVGTTSLPPGALIGALGGLGVLLGGVSAAGLDRGSTSGAGSIVGDRQQIRP